MDLPFVKEAISQLFSKTSCDMYPVKPSEAAPGYRGRIVYHPDRCIACGMCERVCSGNAITRTVEKVEEGDKITLTFNLGSCPRSGNVFRGSYSVAGPLDKYTHVDVSVGGCSPKPEAIVAALAQAAEILAEKRKEMRK